MRRVVADTGPVHYLVLIGQISLLPALFERILIPVSVRDEMLHRNTPDVVRRWIENPPTWLEVMADPVRELHDPELAELDDGERAALLLAESIRAALVLMDDRAGVIAAKRKGFTVTGTLGVLTLAAERRLVDLEAAIAQLSSTNFRYAQRLIDRLLEAHRGRT